MTRKQTQDFINGCGAGGNLLKSTSCLHSNKDSTPSTVPNPGMSKTFKVSKTSAFSPANKPPTSTAEYMKQVQENLKEGTHADPLDPIH